MQTKQTKDQDQDFDLFMDRRLAAAKAYVIGNPDPLGKVTTRNFDATFFGPGGGYEQGTEHVNEVYMRDAKAFGKEGDTDFEILQSGASSDIAFWTGFQKATVTLGGERVEMALRITEIFRRENDEWKLVHRHADPMAEKQKREK